MEALHERAVVSKPTLDPVPVRRCTDIVGPWLKQGTPIPPTTQAQRYVATGVVDERAGFADKVGVEAFNCEVVERRFRGTSGVKAICPFLWNAEDEPSHEGRQRQVPHHL